MGKQKDRGQSNAADSGGRKGASVYLLYVGGVLLLPAAAVMMMKSGSKPTTVQPSAQRSSADTATLQGLMDHGYSFGTVEQPAAVRRISWDPREPLLPWLVNLRVPVVFNNTEIDNWPAKDKWNIRYMQGAFKNKITASVAINKRSGRLVYHDKGAQMLTVAPEIGLTTHHHQDVSKRKFFRAVATNKPTFMRFGGPLEDVLANVETIADDAPNWRDLVVNTDLVPRSAGWNSDDDDLEPDATSIDDTAHLNLWINGANVTSTAHVDLSNNVFIQLEGTKRFTLSPPVDMHLFAPFPVTHPNKRQGQVSYDNWRGNTLSPAFANQVRVLTVDLAPGEVLWLPAYWVHAVEALSATVSASITGGTADDKFFENTHQHAAGKLKTMPFLESGGKWDRSRIAAALTVFIPEMLKLLQPRLGDVDIVDTVTKQMWSPSVRAYFKMDAGLNYPCQQPSEDDRRAALAAATRAVTRLDRHRDDVLLWNVLGYIDILQHHVNKIPGGLLFLEQCLV